MAICFMSKYIRFIYYIYLNKGRIPSRDTEAFMLSMDLQRKYVRVDLQAYAQRALNKQRELTEGIDD